jgi:hypothetical protein
MIHIDFEIQFDCKIKSTASRKERLVVVGASL